MKMKWQDYTGKQVNVTMFENYGIVTDPASNTPVYEIVFKSGVLINSFEDGLLLETVRETGERIHTFIPYGTIKCVEFIV